MIYFAWAEGQHFLVFVLANDLMMTFLRIHIFWNGILVIDSHCAVWPCWGACLPLRHRGLSTVIASGYTLVCPNIRLLYHGFLW